MNLTDYKVKRIISPHGDLQLGEPADVIDEGSFYRIAGTHIIDKFKRYTIYYTLFLVLSLHNINYLTLVFYYLLAGLL